MRDDIQRAAKNAHGRVVGDVAVEHADPHQDGVAVMVQAGIGQRILQLAQKR